MKILVTGAAGFIGSHLCDALLSEGHAIVGVDDLSLGTTDNIKHLGEEANFEFVKLDILEPAFQDLVAKGGFDCVFHLAANSDIARSHATPAVDLDRTLMTTVRVLDAMRAAGIEKIVFSSTSAIYGQIEGSVAESAGPLAPISHYGAAKLASEAFISSYAENYGMQAWITRFPNVVGPRATHGAIFDFIMRLRHDPSVLRVLGDGTQQKPYLYVGDLVDAILYVWKKSNDRFNIYNVGVDSTTTVADIARIVLEEGGIDCTIAFSGGDRGWVGDVPKFAYDVAKINALGWHASRSSDDAVRAAARAIWASYR